jgi:hypothetical protein
MTPTAVSSDAAWPAFADGQSDDGRGVVDAQCLRVAPDPQPASGRRGGPRTRATEADNDRLRADLYAAFAQRLGSAGLPFTVRPFFFSLCGTTGSLAIDVGARQRFARVTVAFRGSGPQWFTLQRADPHEDLLTVNGGDLRSIGEIADDIVGTFLRGCGL